MDWLAPQPSNDKMMVSRWRLIDNFSSTEGNSHLLLMCGPRVLISASLFKQIIPCLAIKCNKHWKKENFQTQFIGSEQFGEERVCCFCLCGTEWRNKTQCSQDAKSAVFALSEFSCGNAEVARHQNTEFQMAADGTHMGQFSCCELTRMRIALACLSRI